MCFKPAVKQPSDQLLTVFCFISKWCRASDLTFPTVLVIVSCTDNHCVAYTMLHPCNNPQTNGVNRSDLRLLNLHKLLAISRPVVLRCTVKTSTRSGGQQSSYSRVRCA